MNLIKRIRACIQYRRAVTLAEDQLAKTGNRQYVIPSGKGLLVIDRNTFRMYKKKGFVSKDKTIMDVKFGCFYATSYRNGNSLMEKAEKESRRRQFFSWYAHTFK